MDLVLKKFAVNVQIKFIVEGPLVKSGENSIYFKEFNLLNTKLIKLYNYFLYFNG